MADKQKMLSGFLREVSEWQYSHYIKERANLHDYTTNQGIVFSLIDTCLLGSIEAIKLFTNRNDGKLETPVEIISPKIFFVYPNAVSVASPEAPTPVLLESPDALIPSVADNSDLEGEVVIEEPVEDEEPPTYSIRETFLRMGDKPRSFPDLILGMAEDIHTYQKEGGVKPIDDPKVRTVVAAHLHKMAQNRKLSAIEQLFNDIDGRLTETIRVVGEDIYLPIYTKEAPYGAVRGRDGVYMIEASKSSQSWEKAINRKVAR